MEKPILKCRMLFGSLAIFWVLSVHTSGLAHAQNTAIIEKFDDLSPEGQPLNWSGFGYDTHVLEENGNHFVRMVNPRVTNVVGIESRVTLDAAWKQVEISAHMRGKITAKDTKNNGAPFLLIQFQDAEYEMVGEQPAALTLTQSSADWLLLKRVYTVPKNAKYVLLSPVLWRTAGTLDVDDLQIAPFDDATPPTKSTQK